MKKPVAFLYLLVQLFPAFILAQAPRTKTKPNIIFIFADDLGYGDIGCYGQQKIETPNINKMAGKGLKFTRFYSGSTVCAPARATFMSGLHTGHAPVRGNKSFSPEGQTPLPDSVVTFVNRLQQNGYATAAFGKWGLGFITTPGDPNKKGFDQFYGYNCQSLAHDYYPGYLWNNHERIDLSVNLKYDSIYSADLIHHQAVRFINESHGNPFFLYLPYTLPHGDVIVPHDNLYYYYIEKFDEIPLRGKALQTRSHNMNPEPYPHAAFASMISRLDGYVGEIVKAVADKGLAENTLIIFTSDNGPHNENGGDPEFFNSNGIFRGIKRDLYEGGIRVPFIAYWPGKIKPDVTDQVAALWDMYPTFLELAGISFNSKIDGISLVPALLQQGKQKQHEYLYWEFHENNGRQALSWKNWKGVRLQVNKNPPSAIELYDLKNDPQERHNVAGKYPGVVKKLEAIINNAHQQNTDWPLLSREIMK